MSLEHDESVRFSYKMYEGLKFLLSGCGEAGERRNTRQCLYVHDNPVLLEVLPMKWPPVVVVHNPE